MKHQKSTLRIYRDSRIVKLETDVAGYRVTIENLNKTVERQRKEIAWAGKNAELKDGVITELHKDAESYKKRLENHREALECERKLSDDQAAQRALEAALARTGLVRIYEAAMAYERACLKAVSGDEPQQIVKDMLATSSEMHAAVEEMAKLSIVKFATLSSAAQWAVAGGLGGIVYAMMFDAKKTPAAR